MVGEMFVQSLRVMGGGVGTVFAVLAVFFGLVKLLIRLFPDKKKEKQ
jgi:Na+-transporting methylmalonyl-CoA/oxaloacetate decarboxylase gamma subunit